MKTQTNKKLLLVSLVIFAVSITIAVVSHWRRVDHWAIVNEWMAHQASFDTVDSIVVQYGERRYTLTAHDDTFDIYKRRLNPFAHGTRRYVDGQVHVSGGIHGSGPLDMNRLNHLGNIRYYAAGEFLFDVNVYAVPDFEIIRGQGVRAFMHEGQQAIVVLDERGWFGGFVRGFIGD